MKKKKEKRFYFSVIMTIYNIEQYLEEAIQSVINQTLSFEENIEIILVNDGSPDNSDKICKKYEQLFPNNIVYIEKENGGVSSARNAGLDVARGRIINFLDSDDYFSENAFAEVKSFFEENKDKTDVVAINLVNFENSCGSWVNKDYFIKTQLIDMNKDYHFMQCQVGASFIKRERALKYRYDEKIKIHEDSHYLYRIFRDMPFCGVICEATYWHRIRNNGTSATQTIKHKNNVFNMSGYLLKDLIEFYKEKNEVIPSFLQTFIILEFNYYVIEKIPDIELNDKEKKELKNNVKNVIDNLSIEDIYSHPYISNAIKDRYKVLKRNINKLYSKSLFEEKPTFKQILKNGYIKMRRFSGKMKKKIKMPFSRTIQKAIELENIIQYQNQKIEDSLQNIIELNNKITLCEQINQKNIETYLSEIKKLNNETEDIKADNNYYIDKDVEYVFYFHGGSRNRGCEALLKTIIENISKDKKHFCLISFRKKEDLNSNIKQIIKYIIEPKLKNRKKEILYMGNVQFNFEDLGIEDSLKKMKNKKIAFSIGGDNYCYGKYVTSLLFQYNCLFHKYGVKTALLGCSIEPVLFDDEEILKDLNMYDLIIARESLTYEALIKAGINKNTVLIPDTAFKLKTIEMDLPENFIDRDIIGINMSPLILEYDKEKVYNNYLNLIKYILDSTNYNVLLIPHVFWKGSNDYEVMIPLLETFSYTNRIILIDEHSSEELKGYIKKCKIFVGARTHATIAAYSNCIPTLVVGYSIKSKGIAKDLFGTYNNYVIPVEELKENNSLSNSFKYIEKNYNNIKKQLEKVIPTYIEKIDNYKNLIQKLEEKKVFSPLPIKECTGCGLCSNVCPINCIKMIDDKDEFKYPVIDYQKCVKCEKCQSCCPVNNKTRNEERTFAYAVKSREKTILESSSGGVFCLIAEHILTENGAVFGAAFDKNMLLKHIKITTKEELFKIQGSKYLQSDVEETFKEVKKLLKENKKVLFSGTPCQIKALKKFIKSDFDSNLFTIDIICHGVPSPKVFRKYKEKLEKDYNSKIIKYNFRNKEKGWNQYSTEIIFENGKRILEPFNENIYMKGFLRNLYLRESCYRCTSNNMTSNSDITLGDYWGLKDIHPDFEDDQGTSLVLVNTKKGQNLLDNIKNKIDIIDTELTDAIKYNKSLCIPAFENNNKENFFANLDNKDIISNINENLYDED